MPGISGPGIRVYPFTHDEVGYGCLLERDDKPDALWLATLPTNPMHTLQMLIAWWLTGAKHEPKTPLAARPIISVCLFCARIRCGHRRCNG